ncbi:protein of unknown function [Chitinophaga terrae (ex Kim and Jung 2007)]|uniref:DUF4249 domain-containing protein n=1 Tax=Chitinophaga terrae (ex Kim and Jung 2007) TaxID=408074 RepID=A0A1H3WYI0_9BACT|nr:DUF4249 family protein [Chitinophaga terrae (ex Kim and Jung 2007)]GEP90273.1 hypothetical protein CTE07_19180 [Chitinophaga terrae (ex Kim and Jung 2007)]SDZ91444.1 protein of unknown function [Chitinophaga terrae (ex Kim and Jung 2007)]
MKRLHLLILLVAGISMVSCEDKINLNVEKGISYPVLDAWITTEQGIQTIKFTMSVPYTDEAPAPIVNDAKITLFDMTSGASYPFTFNNNKYTYDASQKAIGIVDHIYKLHVEFKGEIFEAFDTIKRVPPIDSISYKFKTKDESISGKEGYYATMHAKDIKGAVDNYWIRSYRNDTLHRLEDNFSIDGSYDAGVSDGATFITPIAEGITDYEKPFQANEKAIVRLMSCSAPSYNFVTQVYNQVNAGGLFAKVLENVRSNVHSTTPSSKTKILGWFGTSAVSRAERSFK